MGLGSQMIAWDEEFCGLLAAAGHYVIRYDNRDAGLSTHLDDAGVSDLVAAFAGNPDPAYLLGDLADDAAGLLEALGLPAAHVVGASMGGMIAQEVAIRHPSRVLSLVSIMSRTGAKGVGEPTQAALGALMSPPPSGRDEAIQRALSVWSIIGSPGYPMNVDRITTLAQRAYDRDHNPAGANRQLVAIVASPDRTAALRELDVPTLVIHGEDDPLIQVSGGTATADAVPGAKLLLFPGMGHDLPRDLWPDFVAAITELTTR
ncbi:alpha/beta hydrolase [Streptosporangiaceae bacterium NEAU-GS5]|nr:alpha/beta hydrolase [Streptosporangiaceae bacterium NEAU-GS5]